MPRPPKKFRPHPFAYHQEIEVVIESLTNLGSGVARVDGWVVFVPFTLPGEKVRARVYRNDKNCSHSDLVEVLVPSPDRITPLCPLFGECGGCQYQHFTYARQLEWKTRQVAELLRHMAGLDCPVAPAIASPQIWNYRSKITPHFKEPRGRDLGPIGFLGNGQRSKIIDVPECPIAMDSINSALPAIRQRARDAAATFKRGSTLLLRATPAGVETNPKAVVTESVGNLRFDFLAGDFFQNNPFILPAFTQYVASQAAAGDVRFLVDAYCGSGLFALTLASSFEKVLGVELSESAAAWARRNAAANHITHARFLAASAEAIFAEIDFPANQTAVVIDPPRRGSDPQFLAQLFAFRPARVVYVSCNPATQARDLVAFHEAGYLVTSVQPFDLFPHTRHLECVVTLTPNS
jgi:tRNA/tmRNA/rRNA uracil-C5-methylase (TrmA/RlmC/RlmD family)